MKEKLMIKAAKTERVKRPPIWVMRQAGRYLPEYHEIKEKANGFLGLCKIPEYGIEVSLQPIRRFDFDAAIMFSDILVPAEAMGIELDFNPGPVISNPVRTLADVESLGVPDPDTHLGYVGEIIRGLRSELSDEKTLIGFAGAPFTVASYIVEGGSSKRGFETVRKMIYECPEVLGALLDKLVETTISYLESQVRAGADIVQLFDSSAGYLPPDAYHELAIKPVKRIIAGLKASGIPTIYFAPGAMISLEAMKGVGADVIGVDFRVNLDDARAVLGDDVAVQGNLDPAALLGTPDSVRANVKRILHQNRGRAGHIFNLGHGILPDTPIENVETLVETVREAKPQ